MYSTRDELPPVSPGTTTSDSAYPSQCAVPGSASSAAATATGSAGSGSVPGLGVCWAPGGPPSPNPSTTRSAAEWSAATWIRFSDVASPAARVTAAAPNAIARTIAAARAGALNGRASPRVTGRGSGSRAATRAAYRPRPAVGVRPTARASTAESRPARPAAADAVTVTTASAPTSTATSTQGAIVRATVP